MEDRQGPPVRVSHPHGLSRNDFSRPLVGGVRRTEAVEFALVNIKENIPSLREEPPDPLSSISRLSWIRRSARVPREMMR